MAHKMDAVMARGYQYAEKFVTDVRMRAHDAAEAVFHSLPEIPVMPQMPGLPQMPGFPQMPKLDNIQENVLMQMQQVRTTAVASAHDAYVMFQSKSQAHTLDTPYVVAAMTCLICLFLYKYISPALSARLCPGYNSLSRAKKIEWNSRTVSTLHALLTSFLALRNVLFEHSISENPVWADSFMVRCTVAIVAGYMAADAIIIIMNYKVLGEIGYLLHHFASIYAYYFVISYRTLPWYGNFRLLAEFSTPLVNQRWFYDALGYPKTSPLFLINGIAMAVVFFFVRIVTIPPYWMKVYDICGTPASIRLGKIWYVLLSSCIILDSLNIHWFWKIMRGCKKILFSSLSTAAKKDDAKKQM